MMGRSLHQQITQNLKKNYVILQVWTQFLGLYCHYKKLTYLLIKKIQTNNAIAKYVCVYILQVPVPKVPPFVLGIIPNNSENVSDVYEIHNQVLAYFKIHILSIG